MFPGMGGMNPKLMKQAMKKMGIKQEDVPADEVIIKSGDKDIVIKNPNVTKVNMMGQDTFQVVGEVEEVSSGPSGEDIEMVMSQAGCAKDKAIEALDASDGDIAEAILKAKE